MEGGIGDVVGGFDKCLGEILDGEDYLEEEGEEGDGFGYNENGLNRDGDV